MESPESQSSRDAILVSARREIERAGILGLRVADVASGANSSITQIYRFFKNRDGLLARVLGDMYDEFTENAVSYYKAQIENVNPLTVDTLVDAIPYQLTPEAMRIQELRLQILAASTTNEPLRQRLQAVALCLTDALLLDLEQQRLAARLAQQEQQLRLLVHQLRNPLTALRTFAALLQRRLGPDSQQRDLVEGLLAEERQLNRYVEAISDQLRGNARRALRAINRFPVCEIEDLLAGAQLDPATARPVDPRLTAHDP